MIHSKELYVFILQHIKNNHDCIKSLALIFSSTQFLHLRQKPTKNPGNNTGNKDDQRHSGQLKEMIKNQIWFEKSISKQSNVGVTGGHALHFLFKGDQTIQLGFFFCMCVFLSSVYAIHLYSLACATYHAFTCCFLRLGKKPCSHIYIVSLPFPVA
jgi:hypothetical protein